MRETDIKIVEAVGNLLKAQLIESVEECYIREIHQGDYIEYDDRSLLNILTHIKDKYGNMDAHILKANLKVFGEEPQMDNPIDDYFAKQEQCQRIAETSKYEITDDDMVAMLVEHMGNTGTLTKSTVKFNKQLDENKTWAKSKEWFCDALDDIMEMQKYSGVDQELLANAAVIKDDVKQEARDEIANGMSDSFDMLAQAAVAKSETIDAHASTISALTKALTEATAKITTLTVTNAALVAELAKTTGGRTTGGRTRTPPGLSNNNDTGHTLNTSGVACPTHRFTRPGGNPGRNLTFVTVQDCARCGKKNIYHLPVRCPEAPHMKSLAAATKAAADAIA